MSPNEKLKVKKNNDPYDWLIDNMLVTFASRESISELYDLATHDTRIKDVPCKDCDHHLCNHG